MCCLESEQIKGRLTTDWKAAQVHVLPMMQLSFRVGAFFHDLFSQSPTILNILSSYLYNKEQIYNARFNYGMWAMLATHIKSKCEHQQQQNGQKIVVMFL